MPKNSTQNIEERRQRILELIATGIATQYEEIAKNLGVSTMTVRRDLAYLEDSRFLQKTNAGVYSLKEDITVDPAFTQRITASRERKDAIAEAALEFIEDGDILGIDSSSTALALEKHLAHNAKNNITIVTNSLMAPSILSRCANVELIVAGGAMRKSSFSTIGSVACSTMEHFNYDKAIISANGIDFHKGLCDTNSEEIATKMALIKNAHQVIVLLDSSKFGKRALQSFCLISAIDILITDWGAGDDQVDLIAEAGVQVIRAPKPKECLSKET